MNLLRINALNVALESVSGFENRKEKWTVETAIGICSALSKYCQFLFLLCLYLQPNTAMHHMVYLCFVQILLAPLD